MNTRAIVSISFVVMFAAGCSGSPVRDRAAADASGEPMAAAKKPNKTCVANCTNDYSICVTRGDGSTEDNAECEAEFRACADAC